MPNDLCIFLIPLCCFFVNFTSVSSTDLGKKFSCDCPALTAEAAEDADVTKVVYCAWDRLRKSGLGGEQTDSNQRLM